MPQQYNECCHREHSHDLRCGAASTHCCQFHDYRCDEHNQDCCDVLPAAIADGFRAPEVVQEILQNSDPRLGVLTRLNNEQATTIAGLTAELASKDERIGKLASHGEEIGAKLAEVEGNNAHLKRLSQERDQAVIVANTTLGELAGGGAMTPKAFGELAGQAAEDGHLCAVSESFADTIDIGSQVRDEIADFDFTDEVTRALDDVDFSDMLDGSDFATHDWVTEKIIEILGEKLPDLRITSL